VVDALKQLAVGDSGGGEEGVVAGDEDVGGQHLFQVVALVDGGLPLLVVAGPEPTLDLTAHALEGGGGDDALGGAADAEEGVRALDHHGPGLELVARSVMAINARGVPGPSEVSVVPSMGSTAMSTDGGVPSPISSPLKSMGASSFSPSPMTTMPSMATVDST